MPHGINKVVISGTIAKDPDHEEVGGNNTSLTTFPIAFESTGSKPEHTKTHWLYTKVWGKRADFFKDLPEGTELVAEGQLMEEKWKDKNNNWQARFVLNPGAIQVFTPREER